MTITVTVTDCNDNAPISPGLFTATINEHATVGSEVLRMTYQDADTANPYGVAQFYIVGGAGSRFSHFAMSTSVSWSSVNMKHLNKSCNYGISSCPYDNQQFYLHYLVALFVNSIGSQI